MNTPLGAIRSSADTLSSNLKHTLHEFPKLCELLTSAQQKTFFALLEQSLQGELIFTFREKRAAKKIIAAELKQLGIENCDLTDTFLNLNLHKNIQQYLSLLESTHRDWIFEMAYQLSTLSRSTENISNAVERASKVIFALKTFARYDHSGEKTMSDLQKGIETVITLYYHQIKHSIELIKVYDELPPILCYPDELHQVWTNIVHNALQAMDHKGTLTIAISQQDTDAIVSITDTGTGMSTEVKEKMFMPFFTTKPAG